jgi:hypothetical protein
MKMRTLTPVLLAGAMLLCVGTAGQAQAYIPNTTTLPGNARFEILFVPGPATVQRTGLLKLDRYTGEVWSQSSQNWTLALMEDPPANAKGSTSPRFQIFSPVSVDTTVGHTTILLDCQSGRTWELRLDKYRNTVSESSTWKWVPSGSSEVEAVKITVPAVVPSNQKPALVPAVVPDKPAVEPIKKQESFVVQGGESQPRKK